MVENCEMNSSQYVGGSDVSRMRQAMISRKDDITKAGGMNMKDMVWLVIYDVMVNNQYEVLIIQE